MSDSPHGCENSLASGGLSEWVDNGTVKGWVSSPHRLGNRNGWAKYVLGEQVARQNVYSRLHTVAQDEEAGVESVGGTRLRDGMAWPLASPLSEFGCELSGGAPFDDMPLHEEGADHEAEEAADITDESVDERSDDLSEEDNPEGSFGAPKPLRSTAAEEAAQSFGEEAFRSELLEHLDSMFRLGLSLCKNPRDAEDLTQEATLKALHHWQQYRPGTNMRAWLLAIVRNAFINRYRRQRNRPGNVEFDEVEPFLADSTSGTDQELRHLSVRNLEQLQRMGEQLDGPVKRALEELSDDFRETFLLAVVEELSYKDIAEILGVPVGTVMSRLFRARKQMQSKLADYAAQAGWLDGLGPQNGSVQSAPAVHGVDAEDAASGSVKG